MKIVDRKTFLSLPPNTVFSKYYSRMFCGLCIKLDTCGDDFYCQSLDDSVDVPDGKSVLDVLSNLDVGKSVPMNFDNQFRDGMYDANQLFAVWDKLDVALLIGRLMLCA